jgi:hypothetical protein
MKFVHAQFKNVVHIVLLGALISGCVLAMKKEEPAGPKLVVSMLEDRESTINRSRAVFDHLEQAQNLRELESRINDTLLVYYVDSISGQVCNVGGARVVLRQYRLIQEADYDRMVMKGFLERLVDSRKFGLKEDIYLLMVGLGWVQAVDVLIKCLKVNVYHKDYRGRDALRIAQECGHLGMAQRLALEVRSGDKASPPQPVAGEPQPVTNEIQPGLDDADHSQGMPDMSSWCLLI